MVQSYHGKGLPLSDIKPRGNTTMHTLTIISNLLLILAAVIGFTASLLGGVLPLAGLFALLICGFGYVMTLLLDGAL